MIVCELNNTCAFCDGGKYDTFDKITKVFSHEQQECLQYLIENSGRGYHFDPHKKIKFKAKRPIVFKINRKLKCQTK
jgi:hypothetical protein